jgi:hypothetical protein
VFAALAAGHCFVGNDLPTSTRGFLFSAQSKESHANMGDEIKAVGTVTLQIILPSPGEIRLVHNGKVVKSMRGSALTHSTNEVGVYRVEVYKRFLGRLRGWIFSNPIYIR